MTYLRYLALVLGSSFVLTGPLQADSIDVWLGTSRGRGESKGIYHITLNEATGKLSSPRLVAEIDSPEFLSLHPDGVHLYASARRNGQPIVVAYAIDRDDADVATLRELNSQEIGDGGGTCVFVDRSGSVLLTAQYGGGSIAAFPLAPDGMLQPRSILIEHAGGSQVVPGRQDAPHPHWIGTDLSNRFVYVPDLGLDQVVIYRFDPVDCQLEPQAQAPVAPGAGPRHMKFHPDGQFAYVVNEMDLTVTAFQFDAATGSLTEFQTIPTLPAELKEVDLNAAAEIRIHPSGKFVYASNRGHDSIAVFQVDAMSGELTFVELESIRGSWPRNFNVSPSGNWLLAAGQNSNTLAVFRIDPETGQLVFTREMINVPDPICVEFGGRS